MNSTEYRLVCDFYGDHCATRTGLHYINHIDEGLFVLREIGASILAMKAFIIHPLLQGDRDFAEFYERMSLRSELSIIDPKVLMLAIEYRSVANEYLSYKPKMTIRLSPLKEVNDMLIADKIQNRKDFELFHGEHHEHRERLKEYFREWLSALQVSEEMYQAIKQKLLTSVHGEDNPEKVAKSSILDFLAKDATKRAIQDSIFSERAVVDVNNTTDLPIESTEDRKASFVREQAPPESSSESSTPFRRGDE